MKKIVSLTFADPRVQGGIEGFNRVLKKFYPKEFIMITYSNNCEKIYNVPDVIEIGSRNIFFRITNRILKNKIREFLIKKSIKESRSNIIVLAHPNDLKFLKDLKMTKILVQHSSYEAYIKDFCHGKEEYKNLIKNEADYFVTLSENDAIKFKRELGLNEEKIKIIRHSTNLEILNKRKLKNKKLIMIGRIDNSSKRYDLAIKAMKKLSDYTLDIYGVAHKQSELDYLKDIIKKENIINVKFKGVTNKVQEKLDESGIFIMTSDFEGYPISTIEAMRRGLPIVLRNTFDSAQDIVINNGVLLEKEWNEDKFVEAVRKVYENYEYYSENSKKLGERHSSEVIKKEWDKLFIEIEEK